MKNVYNAAPKKEFHYCFMSNVLLDVDLKDAEAAMKVLVKSMKKKHSDWGELEINILNDFNEVDREIRADKLDFIGILPYDYLTQKINKDFTPMVAATISKEPEGEYYLLVHRNKNISKLEDLKSKKIFLVTSRTGNLPLVWLNTILLKAGLPEINSFFSEAKETNKASQGILPVFFGQYDACLVHRYLYETIEEMNPQIGKDLMILASSPPVIVGMGCINNNADKEYSKLVFETLTNLDNDPRGRQFLTLLKINKLAPFEPYYLEHIKAIFDEYDRVVRLNKNIRKKK
ncbi:MAG: hypothetical protein QG635_1330 [Bacteroidota bacterium]|nr:hypothetical protein [Bacteroidota bacterium]